MTAKQWLMRLPALVLILARSAVAQEDPGAAGTHNVTTAQYTGADVDLGCDSGGCSIPGSEFLAEVRYPTDLANGPYPVVVMLHGRHSPCYDLTTGVGQVTWPCPSGSAAVASYKGYDYLAQLLASHGIIAVSISANAIVVVDDMVGGGYAERAELIQRHLDQWKVFSTTGAAPFGTSFVGRVDLSRVGTMGHSRGGRAVIDHFALNASLGSPYGIRAVLPLAPIRNNSTVINKVPLGVMLGYCDGDTDVVGVRYFDDSRYNVADDNSPKYVLLGMGANHNYFNRFWTKDQFAPGTCCSASPPSTCAVNSCVSKDDWSKVDSPQTDSFCGTNAAGNGRLSSAQQRGFAKAYIAAFFRRHLQAATQFDPLLKGDELSPLSAQGTTVYQSYFPGVLDRKDLNRLTEAANLTTNTLVGATAPIASSPNSTGLAQYSLCGPGTSPTGGFVTCVTATSRRPQNTAVMLELGWPNLSATYSNSLPIPKRDVSNFEALQFRVGVDYGDTRNAAGAEQDFSIRFVDGAGRSSIIRAKDYSDVLYYPPATTNRRVSLLSTLRVPMSAMLNVDVTNVASVDLLFNRNATGAILVSDIAFAGEGITASEKWLVATSANF